MHDELDGRTEIQVLLVRCVPPGRRVGAGSRCKAGSTPGHLRYTATCNPLILDDVTVYSDENRTAAALDMLHALSKEQQVIVFSQEQEVLDWAERNLREGDRLVRLKGASRS